LLSKAVCLFGEKDIYANCFVSYFACGWVSIYAAHCLPCCVYVLGGRVPFVVAAVMGNVRLDYLPCLVQRVRLCFWLNLTHSSGKLCSLNGRLGAGLGFEVLISFGSVPF